MQGYPLENNGEHGGVHPFCIGLITSSRRPLELVGNGQESVAKRRTAQRVSEILHALPRCLHRSQVPQHFSLQVIPRERTGWHDPPTLPLHGHTGRPDSRNRIILQIVQAHHGSPCDWGPRGVAHWAAWHWYVFVTGFTPHPMSHRRIRSPGKTSFLKFMLIWLLSDQQVVLLCNNRRVYLFYRDEVYSQPTSDGLWALPVHLTDPHHSIWALIDVDYQEHGPPITGDQVVWPIQASSPNPARWRSWHKQFGGAALWGMPLWSLKELNAGYAFSSFCRPSRGSSLTLLHLCNLRSLPLSPGYNKIRRCWKGASRSFMGQQPPKQAALKLTLYWRSST